MHELLFRNRRVALAFAFALLVMVRSLIGTADEQGPLSKTTGDITPNVQALQRKASEYRNQSQGFGQAFEPEPVPSEEEAFESQPAPRGYSEFREPVDFEDDYDASGEDAEAVAVRHPRPADTRDIAPDIDASRIINNN